MILTLDKLKKKEKSINVAEACRKTGIPRAVWQGALDPNKNGRELTKSELGKVRRFLESLAK